MVSFACLCLDRLASFLALAPHTSSMTSLSCFSVHFRVPPLVFSLDTVVLARCFETLDGVDGPNWPELHGPP
jgi:hypothetical protein